MLYGEHAVVYGYPCIVTTVDRRITVQVTATDSGKLSIMTDALATPFETDIGRILPSDQLPKPVRFVATAIRKLLEQSGCRPNGLQIVTKRQFHHEYGLGSSSAVTVAAIKACASLLGVALSEEAIFELGFATVLEVQDQRGSGFDVASATYGGTICYERGKSLPTRLERPLPLFVVYSGIKASTTALVGQVAALKQQQAALVDSYFSQSAAIVERAFRAIDSAEFDRAGQLMGENQRLLNALGVSTDSLDMLIAAANLSGAWGSKLSGAGGGDCIIGFADNRPMSQIEAAMKLCKQHFVPELEWLALPTAVPGVQLEAQE